MKLINKFTYFIVFFVLINTSIFLIASNEDYTKGLKNICLWKYDVNRAYKWEFKERELNEILEYAWFDKKILDRAGFKTDDLSMLKYFSYVNALTKRLWNSSIDKLLECGSFGGHKDTCNRSQV